MVIPSAWRSSTFPSGSFSVGINEVRDEFQLREIMKAQLQTVAVVGIVWILLDVFFAKLFFLFPVDSAHFPPIIWGYTWGETGCTTLWTLLRLSCYKPNLPLEELLFYLGSAFVLKLMYMWITEDFFSKYAPARSVYEQYGIEPLWKWNWSYAGLGVALFGAAVLVKKALLPWLFNSTWYGRYFPVDWSSVEGWPFYFMAELIILFVPVSGFFDQVRRFTNPRGFLFLTVFTVLISLAWEATLAIPYGWWGYQQASTIGIFVRPWSNIPIEGPWLWISTGTSVMVVYEVAKIKALSRRTWPQALCGVDTWWQAFAVIFGLRRR